MSHSDFGPDAWERRHLHLLDPRPLDPFAGWVCTVVYYSKKPYPLFDPRTCAHQLISVIQVGVATGLVKPLGLGAIQSTLISTWEALGPDGEIEELIEHLRPELSVRCLN